MRISQITVAHTKTIPTITSKLPQSLPPELTLIVSELSMSCFVSHALIDPSKTLEIVVVRIMIVVALHWSHI